MVDKEDALIREVDEELRREQWAKLWERYGTYIIGAALLLVVIVGGHRVWQDRQLARAAAAGAQYNEAMRLASTGKADESAKLLDELAASGPGGYPALAELQRAGAMIKAGRPLDSLAIFEKIAKDSGTDSMLRDFAALQAASIRLGVADFTEMQNRLNPLAAETSPWRHSARELIGLAAIKAGKFDDARAALGAILGDREAPQGALERARVMLGSIASQELAKAAAAAAEAAPSGAASTAPGTGPGSGGGTGATPSK
jgi:hypothetical protein